MVKLWFVYLIECTDGSIYTGIAVDIAARYSAHCAGKGARYTRSHPPQRLLAAEQQENHSAALRKELHIKKMRPAAKRKYAQTLRERYGDPISVAFPHSNFASESMT